MKFSMIVRAAVSVLITGAAAYALNKFEYLASFGDIDNIVGMMPVVLALVCAAGIVFILWAGIRKTPARVTVAAALLAIVSAALFPTALRGNWWISAAAPDGREAAPDLTLYAPFTADSKIAKTDGPPELTLTGDLPVIDGATALYPLYAAFAEAVYDENAYTDDRVLCTNTRGAYEAVISGERDVVFVAGASAGQLSAAEAAGADLRFTPIGREAFVFLVGADNPIDGVSYRQIRNVYSGKTAYWKTFGWREGGEIIAFQRPEGSGSQTGLIKIMGGIPVQAPRPLPDRDLIGVNSLMRQVSVEWRGVQPAIGYSYRYYATSMYANPDAKLLKIDGAEPSLENIRSGKYPFVADFFAVTNGAPEGNTKLLIDWILSSQGREIIEKTGYTPL
jgi:phosphate transport system substrate-binding protein